MKLSSAIIAMALARRGWSAFLAPRACHAGDNCARAVTGTESDVTPSLAVRQADCSSFMVVTITPAVSTSTRTVTALSTTTATVTEPPSKAKREPVAGAQEDLGKRALSGLPPYASACTAIAQYSSICSCWGITASTTTLPTSVVVVQTTTVQESIVTTSTCPVSYTQCGATCNNLQTDANNCGTCGKVCGTGSTCQSGSCTAPAGACTNVASTCPITAGDTAPRCGGSCGSGDICFPWAENPEFGFCGDGNSPCGATSCTSDAQCGTGGRCLTTCCNIGGPTRDAPTWTAGASACFTPSQWCFNSANPSRLFVRRAATVGARAAGLTVSGLMIGDGEEGSGN